MAVNLSRRTLQDPELPEMVAQLLARWDVAPNTLILELTESSLMADPLRASENLSRLRALGVQMSIDIAEPQPRSIVAGVAEAYPPEQLI